MNHELLLINVRSNIKARLLPIYYNLIADSSSLMLSYIGRMLFPIFLFNYKLLIQYIADISFIFLLVCRSSNVLIFYPSIILLSDLNSFIFCVLTIICVQLVQLYIQFISWNSKCCINLCIFILELVCWMSLGIILNWRRRSYNISLWDISCLLFSLLLLSLLLFFLLSYHLLQFFLVLLSEYPCSFLSF